MVPQHFFLDLNCFCFLPTSLFPLGLVLKSAFSFGSHRNFPIDVPGSEFAFLKPMFYTLAIGNIIKGKSKKAISLLKIFGSFLITLHIMSNSLACHNLVLVPTIKPSPHISYPPIHIWCSDHFRLFRVPGTWPASFHPLPLFTCINSQLYFGILLMAQGPLPCIKKRKPSSHPPLWMWLSPCVHTVITCTTVHYHIHLLGW